MKVAALKGKVRHLDIVFKEEDGFDPGEMWIDYQPGELTIDVIESVQDGMNDGGESGAIADMLGRILVDWDLENEDGSKVPPTPEGIRLLPLPALGFIFGSMMEDIRPKEQKVETSDDTSQQEERQETSLVGT